MGLCESQDADLAPDVDKTEAQHEIVALYSSGLTAFNEWLKDPKSKIDNKAFSNYHYPFLLSVDKNVTNIQTMKMLSTTMLQFWKKMEAKGVVEGKLIYSSVEVTGSSSAKLKTNVHYVNAEGEIVQEVSQQHIYTLIPDAVGSSSSLDGPVYKWAATMTLI